MKLKLFTRHPVSWGFLEGQGSIKHFLCHHTHLWVFSIQDRSDPASCSSTVRSRVFGSEVKDDQWRRDHGSDTGSSAFCLQNSASDSVDQENDAWSLLLILITNTDQEVALLPQKRETQTKQKQNRHWRIHIVMWKKGTLDTLKRTYIEKFWKERRKGFSSIYQCVWRKKYLSKGHWERKVETITNKKVNDSINHSKDHGMSSEAISIMSRVKVKNTKTQGHL